MDWPEWWSWEIELSPHVLKRMVDRGFSETDLRDMLETARGYSENYEPGRYTIMTRHAEEDWEVIVEPSPAESLLIIVTAYRIE